MEAIEYRARFPVDPRTPAQARRLVRCLEHTLDPGQLENLELLVTELVTNSVRHAGLVVGGWIGIEVQVTPDRVRVEVMDPGRGFDRHAALRAREDVDGTDARGSGWGLFLVDQLAQRWGVHHDEFTRVWFEMPTAPMANHGARPRVVTHRERDTTRRRAHDARAANATSELR